MIASPSKTDLSQWWSGRVDGRWLLGLFERDLWSVGLKLNIYWMLVGLVKTLREQRISKNEFDMIID